MSRALWVTAILAYLVTLSAVASPRIGTASLGQTMTTPCATEDGGPVRPCRWDARTMGNREGSTVYLIIDQGDGYRVLYGP